jgi:hypothetical protein
MQVFFYQARLAFGSGLTFYLLAMSRMTTVKVSTIREELTEQCSAILYSYRRNCAAATMPTQVRPLGSHVLKHGHLDNFAS